MKKVVISGTGLWNPRYTVSNEELVSSYNASAGSLIAHHLYNGDLVNGDFGFICSFGAGYCISNILVSKNGSS